MDNKHVAMEVKEDFGWIDQLDIREIDGRLMLAGEDQDLPFNISHVIEEKEFLAKYLLGFALGNSIGINYFPSADWYSFTFNGTRAVLVVKRNEETGKVEPVLLVPPLITTNLTDEDRSMLRRASDIIYTNAHDNLKADNMSANMEVADVLADEEIGLKAKRITYQDLITPSYFESKKIVPEVEQKLYYIRDIIRNKRKTEIEDLNRARDIFFREYKSLPVSQEEYKFINELTLGEYEIEEKVANAPATVDANDKGETPAIQVSVNDSKEADPENPLEC